MSSSRDELIVWYFSLNYSYSLILCFLQFVHGISLSLRQLKRHLKRLNLRRRHPVNRHLLDRTLAAIQVRCCVIWNTGAHLQLVGGLQLVAGGVGLTLFLVEGVWQVRWVFCWQWNMPYGHLPAIIRKGVVVVLHCTEGGRGGGGEGAWLSWPNLSMSPSLLNKLSPLNNWDQAMLQQRNV